MAADRSPTVLVLDAMGVMYDKGNLVQAHLIPFARDNGSRLPDRDILGHYLQCSAGEMSSEAFWRELGVTGEGDALDTAYVARHRLVEGLISFLAWTRTSGTRVVCLSNDVAEWSVRLRRLHGLEAYIDHWTISGDVKSRKPSVGIYRCLLDATGLRAEECLFVDDKAPNLDVARELGFHTCLFAPSRPGAVARDSMRDAAFRDFQLGSSRAEGSAHPVARNFGDVRALLTGDAGDGAA
ncbi:HAD-IA family hydrolase [Candidatus Poribacteria bacterium]|nr:HAD-IA family hydrolase [Candidatus Poribacteria bacterium]MBT5535264.1 HAD-IA family hydrolase [Candidatus Poribacteria bacterium]MBT5711253.1 HAD-IA family hydrolase [Candidatus Poribacteria bacterium]MBT7101053.1 HAD-IA family hydrolase [Candidatus Poribacteria bacterium]MBT7807139.1 HAD-IA family hydrolase [Candidatus Poribacteria bacterium]